MWMLILYLLVGFILTPVYDTTSKSKKLVWITCWPIMLGYMFFCYIAVIVYFFFDRKD